MANHQSMLPLRGPLVLDGATFTRAPRIAPHDWEAIACSEEHATPDEAVACSDRRVAGRCRLCGGLSRALIHSS